MGLFSHDVRFYATPVIQIIGAGKHLFDLARLCFSNANANKRWPAAPLYHSKKLFELFVGVYTPVSFSEYREYHNG